MGSYATPFPDKQVVQPVIAKDSKSCSRMGFIHPELAKMLCLVKYLGNYLKDPAKTFQGFLLEQIIKHIFTLPSSVLTTGASNGTHPCNAKIHAMSKVEAEHIAYAAIQVHFGISSLNKLNDKDGYFPYSDFYTRITRLICDRKDGEWVDSLLAHYNKMLFGNENGVRLPHSENIECSDDNNMVTMKHQLAARAAHTSRSMDPPPAEPLVLQQEPCQNPLPPLPQKPTLESPSTLASVSDAPCTVSPLPPLYPQDSVTSTPLITCKHKIVAAHNLFNNDSPLMDDR
ncbi:hypothetical protein BDR05DRAFT_948923 [Suillus weaverae]|nr:hypothetical protein BDR05DRAFT_948923 [Suillus weaverae]